MNEINTIAQVNKIEFPANNQNARLNVFFNSDVFYNLDSVVWIPFLGNFIIDSFSIDESCNTYKYIATSLKTRFKTIFTEDKPPLHFIGENVNLFTKEDGKIAINNSLYC